MIKDERMKTGRVIFIFNRDIGIGIVEGKSEDGKPMAGVSLQAVSTPKGIGETVHERDVIGDQFMFAWTSVESLAFTISRLELAKEKLKVLLEKPEEGK